MTPAQTKRYFYEWARVRDVLKSQGRPHGDMERHALHKRALGAMKSSRDFTNADFDKVLATFLAITEPDNLTAQLKLIEQPDLRRKMMIERIHELAEEVVDVGASEPYLAGLTRKIFRAPLSALTERQLGVLTGILTARVRQIRRRKVKQAPGALSSAAEGADIPF